MRTQRTRWFVLASLCVLLIPFFAMQFHIEGWDWHFFDYAIIAVLLAILGVGLAAATNTAFPLSRRMIGIGVVILMLALYVHLAVGIVDWLPLAGS